MARCCDALFLLAETEVPMTTVISSHVKDKNCMFTGYQIFVAGKILEFRRCLYNNYIYISMTTEQRDIKSFLENVCLRFKILYILYNNLSLFKTCEYTLESVVSHEMQDLFL